MAVTLAGSGTRVHQPSSSEEENTAMFVNPTLLLTDACIVVDARSVDSWYIQCLNISVYTVSWCVCSIAVLFTCNASSNSPDIQVARLQD